MKTVKLDCGYCLYEFCPVQESDGKLRCPFIREVSDNYVCKLGESVINRVIPVQINGGK